MGTDASLPVCLTEERSIAPSPQGALFGSEGWRKNLDRLAAPLRPLLAAKVLAVHDMTLNCFLKWNLPVARFNDHYGLPLRIAMNRPISSIPIPAEMVTIPA